MERPGPAFGRPDGKLRVTRISLETLHRPHERPQERPFIGSPSRGRFPGDELGAIFLVHVLGNAPLTHYNVTEHQECPMKKTKRKVTGTMTLKTKPETVTITRKKLQEMKDEIEGLKATLDLLGNPHTAKRVRAALKQANAGKLKEFDL
jgi:hypothetical protein